MWTEVYWVAGPWPGKLAVSPRPRGGDWLEDAIAGWRRDGVDQVLSLLTPGEEKDLDLEREAHLAQGQGIKFRSFPIPDRQVPASGPALAQILGVINKDLASGKNVLIHCRQGIGRTGLVAACLLVSQGLDPATAIDRVSSARGLPVPETDEQKHWIDRYAAVAAGAK
jgi:protein-tyrosine phosphatase